MKIIFTQEGIHLSHITEYFLLVLPHFFALMNILAISKTIFLQDMVKTFVTIRVGYVTSRVYYER